MDRPRLHQPRRCAHHRGLDDRQRRRPRHRRRPRDLLDPGAVGAGGVHARVRVDAAAVRVARRPVRTPSHPADRRRAVRGCLGGRRSRGFGRPPHRRTARPGRRRGDDAAEHPLAAERHVPRAGTRYRVRRLGVHDRRNGGRGAAPRRLADDRLLLAVGIRDQRSPRHPDLRGCAADRGGVAGRCRGPSRRGGRRTVRAALRHARLRPHRGAHARVVAGRRRFHDRKLDVAVEHLACPDRVRGDDRRPRPLRPLGPASLARGQSDPSRPETVLDLDIPQRQPRGARRGARRVRHHPVAADLAAVRAGLRRAADGPRTDRPCGGILRRERIRRGIQRQGQPRADRAPGPRGRDRRHRVGRARRRS